MNDGLSLTSLLSTARLSLFLFAAKHGLYFILKQKGKTIENNINFGQHSLILNSLQCSVKSL